MLEKPTIGRRGLLRGTGLALVGGLVALAGCGGGDGDDGGTPTETTMSGLDPLDIPGDVETEAFANHLEITEHGAFTREDEDLVVVQGTIKSDQDTTGQGTAPKLTCTFLDAEDGELGSDAKGWEKGMDEDETRNFTLQYSGTVSDVAKYHICVESVIAGQ